MEEYELHENDSDALVAGFAQAKEKIEAIHSGGDYFESIRQIGVLSETGHRLLHPQWAFAEVEGQLDEVSLQCERGHVGFPVEPDVVYKVDPALSSCWMRILGRPDTSFMILELNERAE